MKLANWKSTNECFPPKGARIIFWDADNNLARIGTAEYNQYGDLEAAVDGDYRTFQHWMHIPFGPFHPQRTK